MATNETSERETSVRTVTPFSSLSLIGLKATEKLSNTPERTSSSTSSASAVRGSANSPCSPSACSWNDTALPIGKRRRSWEANNFTLWPR